VWNRLIVYSQGNNNEDRSKKFNTWVQNMLVGSLTIQKKKTQHKHQKGMIKFCFEEPRLIFCSENASVKLKQERCNNTRQLAQISSNMVYKLINGGRAYHWYSAIRRWPRKPKDTNCSHGIEWINEQINIRNVIRLRVSKTSNMNV